MKRIIAVIISITTGACVFIPSPVFQNSTAINTEYTISPSTPLPYPAIYTQSPEITPLSTDLPIPTNTQPIATPTALPTQNANGSVLEEIPCGNSLRIKVVHLLEYKKDLFEHHAVGIFLIVLLQVINDSSQPVQIWDGDYLVEGVLYGKKVIILPHQAATGYLFITRGNDLSQDKIQPGDKWKTYLAFDINPAGIGWTLVVTPGKDGGRSICEARIDLDT